MVALSKQRRHGLWVAAAVASICGLGGALAPTTADAQTVPEIRPYGPNDSPGSQSIHGWADPPPRRVPALESTLYLSVPLWNDVPRDIVRPGFSMAYRGGFDLGYVVPEWELGYRWVWVDVSRAADENPGAGIPRLGTETLRSFYFGAGLRLHVPNDSIVTPYASTIFTFNWWNFLETSYGCGWWYCSTFDVYRFTPGFNWRFGLSFEINRYLYAEAGLGVGFSFTGDFYDDNQSWLLPYAGLTFRK